MNEYEALRSEIMTVMDSLNEYGRTVTRYMGVANDQVAALWDDQAELRDEIHAVANRLENLTRAVTTDPAEVAQAIVNDANRSTRRCDGIDHVWHDSRARFGEWCDCGTVRYGEQYLTPEQQAEVRDARQS